MAHRFGLAALLGLFVLLPAAARAADPAALWSGFYAGAHVGGLSGKTNFSDPAGPSLFGGDVTTPGFLGGLQLGYDWAVAPRWIVGAQIDGSLVSSQGSMTCLQHNSTTISSDCQIGPRAFATLTGRLGWVPADGRLLLYGKGGLAWMRADASIYANHAFSFAAGGEPVSQRIDSLGWTAGAGVEYAFAPAWSVLAEYNFMRFAGARMGTPNTVDVTPDGTENDVAGSSTGLTSTQHVAKLGLNYRFGAAARGEADRRAWMAQDREAWTPGWEFDVGGRYWYSSGTFRNSNGSRGIAISRLTYDNMVGHSGELFGRLDSPFNVFVKALVGGGALVSGFLNDEDWGISESPPVSYSNTVSSLSGSFNFMTVDLGYNLMRGPDHKLGVFIGYNRTQMIMSGFGCAQVANPSAGICQPPFDPSRNSLSELDVWQSLRVGASAEVQIAERFKLSGDFAYLPAVRYDGLDIHHLREPTVYFPVTGVARGVQAEILLSYRATEALSIGIGGRYWAWWTTDAQQTNEPNYFDSSMQRYGVFLQASYKFNPR